MHKHLQSICKFLSFAAASHQRLHFVLSLVLVLYSYLFVLQ